MALEFKLPDLGEGLTEGEIVAWKVKEGDSIAADAPLVTILTDKAEVEIPSPKGGTVLKQLFQTGQKVQVGQVFVVIGEKGEAYTPAAKPAAEAPKHAVAGNGASTPLSTSASATTGAGASATPAVRKLAKDMGVNLDSLKGTGPGGRITEEDVKRTAGGAAVAAAAPAGKSGGPEERVVFAGIRRRTAEKMLLSSNSIPHVTHIDEADVSDLIALREELKPEATKRGVKLSYLAFVIKAVVKGLKEFPYFNSSLDEAASQVVLKKYYNIGIAIDTPHGLFSPIIKEADKKSLWDVAGDVEKLANKARDNKLEIADLTGGTFTITNIGPLGGTLATPIIVYPECAILATMSIKKMPVVRDGKIAPRDMMNLCLSFDHRLVDGAEAARFTNTIIKSLENPRTLL